MTIKGRVKSAERKVDRFISRHNLNLNQDQRDEMLHMVESLLANRDRVINHKKKQVRKMIAADRLEPNQKHLNAINHGLRIAIGVYGPITSERIGSASKRILAAILSTEQVSEEELENVSTHANS